MNYLILHKIQPTKNKSQKIFQIIKFSFVQYLNKIVGLIFDNNVKKLKNSLNYVKLPVANLAKSFLSGWINDSYVRSGQASRGQMSWSVEWGWDTTARRESVWPVERRRHIGGGSSTCCLPLDSSQLWCATLNDRLTYLWSGTETSSTIIYTLVAKVQFLSYSY